MNAKLITPLDKSILYPRFRKLIEILQEKGVIQYGLLVALTLLAAVMRLYKLGEWSFWIDEIFTIDRAQIHFSDAAAFLRSLPSTLWLPLSVIFTEIFLKNLSVSEWSARLAPALIGIASVPILFFPVRKLAGLRVALIFAFLLAISPWHVFWSQNARFYTSLMLLYTLASLAFFYTIEHDRPIFLLAFYIFFYFSISERLISLFILPVIVIYIITIKFFHYELPPGINKRNLLLLILPILVLFLHDAIRYIIQDSSIISNAINDFSGKQFDDPLRLAIAIIFNLSLPVSALGGVSGLYLLLNKSRLGTFLFLSAVIPSVGLLILNPFMFTKDRYVFMTLPFWLLLAAIAINQIITNIIGNRKLLAVGIIVIFIAEAAGANILYYHVNNGDRRDWKGAFEIIKQHSIDGDTYVAWWPEFGPYYLGKEIIPYKNVTPESIIGSGRRYWFIVDSETVYGNEILYAWLQNRAQLIEVLYLRMPEDDFNLRIYKYDPNITSSSR